MVIPYPMRIFVEDSFDSAHWLPNVPVGHKCGQLHGHTYRIRLEFSGDVDPVMGWVIDYSEIKTLWGRVKSLLDHKCLNDILSNPTCENIALFVKGNIGDTYAGLSRIEIRETERCGVVLDCK
jgi:6-pyruvoyltetrahydropterin/6-carboxytetrahydropterin synthase